MGFEVQAQRMANTLEHIHDPEARTMGADPRKISVVLQNQSSVSNAFVSITPRRSEFYTMPSQDYNFLGTNDWLNLLSSHEYRHVVQFQHSNRGLSRAFYYLFGANTLSALSHAAAPLWFWEGDAVATETAFTHSGRGRIPYFGLVFKTNLMEGRTFNYQKQYLRSYKNNIPDHYVLGYHMISYLRRRTNDPEIWSKITARAWNIPIIPFRFSSAIKMETGLSVNGLYRAMAADLKKDWQAEIDALHLTSFNNITFRQSTAYTNYAYPQVLNDGSVIVMKSGIGDIETFSVLKDGEEHKVYTPGIINGTGMLSASGSTVIWNEFGYDPRWSVRNYSLIKAYDLKTKQKWVIGNRKDRYAGASLSPDGKAVVTIRSGNDYKVSVLVLSFPGGMVLKEFPNPDNYFYAMPRWSADGKKIVALKNTPAGKTISLFDYDSGTITDLFPPSQENVGYPVLTGNYLLYNSPISGIDNIYAINLETQQKFQVSSSKYGAYNAGVSPDQKLIYYNEQTRDGLDVVKIPFDPASWKPYEEKEPEIKPLSETLARQEGRSTLLDSIPHQVLPVKRYSKFKGMINPYSWGLFVDNNLAQASAGIMSQDILSTTTFNAGYQLDINERTTAWKAGLSYQGIFTIFDFGFSSGDRKVDKGDYPVTISNTKNNKTVTTVQDQNVKLQWHEQNVEAGLRIPLNLTHSKYYSNISIANNLGYTKVTGFTNGLTSNRYLPALIKNDTIFNFYPFYDYVGNGNLVYNHFSVSGYRLLKTSRRDINSKLGQLLYLDLYNTPYGGDYSGSNFSLYTQLYFPGLFKHHSLWGYWAYQSTEIHKPITLDDHNYYFRNNIPLPRGLSISRFQQMYSMSANYTFPLWYPDVHVGPLLNLQRVRVNAFFDYGFGQSKLYNISQSYTSTGVEVKFDFNIMRFLPQFNLGVRYSEGLNPSASKVELLIGTFNF